MFRLFIKKCLCFKRRWAPIKLYLT